MASTGSIFIIHYSLFITHYSLLIIHYSLKFYSLPITHYSLLTTRCSVRNGKHKLTEEVDDRDMECNRYEDVRATDGA